MAFPEDSSRVPPRPYVATVVLKSGLSQKVTVYSDSSFDARIMLEAEYGEGSIVLPPTSA